jgi:hypothetical protein
VANKADRTLGDDVAAAKATLDTATQRVQALRHDFDQEIAALKTALELQKQTGSRTLEEANTQLRKDTEQSKSELKEHLAAQVSAAGELAATECATLKKALSAEMRAGAQEAASKFAELEESFCGLQDTVKSGEQWASSVKLEAIEQRMGQEGDERMKENAALPGQMIEMLEPKFAKMSAEISVATAASKAASEQVLAVQQEMQAADSALGKQLAAVEAGIHAASKQQVDAALGKEMASAAGKEATDLILSVKRELEAADATMRSEMTKVKAAADEAASSSRKLADSVVKGDAALSRVTKRVDQAQESADQVGQKVTAAETANGALGALVTTMQAEAATAAQGVAQQFETLRSELLSAQGHSVQSAAHQAAQELAALRVETKQCDDMLQQNIEALKNEAKQLMMSMREDLLKENTAALAGTAALKKELIAADTARKKELIAADVALKKELGAAVSASTTDAVKQLGALKKELLAADAALGKEMAGIQKERNQSAKSSVGRQKMLEELSVGLKDSKSQVAALEKDSQASKERAGKLDERLVEMRKESDGLQLQIENVAETAASETSVLHQQMGEARQAMAEMRAGAQEVASKFVELEESFCGLHDTVKSGEQWASSVKLEAIEQRMGQEGDERMKENAALPGQMIEMLQPTIADYVTKQIAEHVPASVQEASAAWPTHEEMQTLVEDRIDTVVKDWSEAEASMKKLMESIVKDSAAQQAQSLSSKIKGLAPKEELERMSELLGNMSKFMMSKSTLLEETRTELQETNTKATFRLGALDSQTDPASLLSRVGTMNETLVRVNDWVSKEMVSEGAHSRSVQPAVVLERSVTVVS